jgi:hypothetical protein
MKSSTCPKKLDGPPAAHRFGRGLELSGIAKLDDGSRLIMLLDVANLMRDQKLREMFRRTPLRARPRGTAPRVRQPGGFR